MVSPQSFLSGILILSLWSCGPATRHDPVLAEAFVGPASVNVHKEISPKTPIVAALHFGEKVEIIGTKRKFVKVRTRGGAEGWLEEHSLLGQNEMDLITAQSNAARKYPSQGVAMASDAMNVHAQPNRYSPSYLQLREGERFDVLEHRLVAVPPGTVRKNLIPAPKTAKRTKKPNKAKIPPPPAPDPPPLPLDWIDLSKAGEDAVPPKVEEPPPTTPEEDWSLIRTASGQSGWVLTRRLYMAIPDEVAQYAEGKRITSYFSLGKVHDQDRVKDIWLWTTSEAGNRPYDFDAYRVFIWSLRHHRYETALIQRRIRGHFPTEVNASTGTFGLCIEKEDGHRYRREYKLVQAQVKFANEVSCDAGATGGKDQAPNGHKPDEQNPSEGAIEKLKGKLKSIMK